MKQTHQTTLILIIENPTADFRNNCFFYFLMESPVSTFENFWKEKENKG